MIKLTSQTAKNHKPVFDLTLDHSSKSSYPVFTTTQFSVPRIPFESVKLDNGREYVPVVDHFYEEYKDSGKIDFDTLTILCHRLSIPRLLDGSIEQPRDEHRQYIRMSLNNMYGQDYEDGYENTSIHEDTAITAVISHFAQMETISEQHPKFVHGSFSHTAEFIATACRLSGLDTLIETLHMIYGKH